MPRPDTDPSSSNTGSQGTAGLSQSSTDRSNIKTVMESWKTPKDAKDSYDILEEYVQFIEANQEPCTCQENAKSIPNPFADQPRTFPTTICEPCEELSKLRFGLSIIRSWTTDAKDSEGLRDVQDKLQSLGRISESSILRASWRTKVDASIDSVIRNATSLAVATVLANFAYHQIFQHG